MTKNANFEPNLVVLGQKILILTEESKGFGTHITEKKHLGTLFALFFGRAWDEMGQKCQYLAKNAIFGPNLAVFGTKILIFMRVSKSFGTHIGTFVVLFFGRHGPKMPIFGQKSQFWAEVGRIRAKNPILYGSK